MLIDVHHVTRYTYSAPVRLDPQLARLKPRTDPFQALRRFDLRIQPPGAQVSEGPDPEGNTILHVVVEGPVTLFELDARSLVETRVPPEAPQGSPAAGARFPLQYPADVPLSVLVYRAPTTTDVAVNRFAAEVADGAGWEVLPFLALLAARIQKTHAYQIRYEGYPRPGAMTLERREGACRDFAALYMEACRAMGLAVRFVSGYRIKEPEGIGRELHAWVEVFLPGLGWRGYDPTIGKPVTDQHVAVAAGTPSSSAPVTGSFWGSGVTSQLYASVEVRRAMPEVMGAT